MHKENFFLNSDTYENNYKPVFDEKKYNFKSVIQYLIVLPYELALSENCIISLPEKNEVYCFNFKRLEKEKSYSAGGEGEPGKIPFNETCVEMSLFTEKIYYLTEKIGSEIFDRLLEYLNYIITSYLIKTKQEDIYIISKEMLEPFSLSRHVNIPDFNTISNNLLFLHPNIVYQKEMLDIEKQSEIVRYSTVVKDNSNPFLLSEELMINARRDFKRGFYKETILNAQTSVETLLRILFQEILKIEGLSDEEIETKQQNLGFITMVKKEFSSRIGGSWDIKNTRKEVGNWHENCYLLRNRIAHGGYQPNFVETDRGIYSADKLRVFLVKRIRKTSKFKGIAEYL